MAARQLPRSTSVERPGRWHRLRRRTAAVAPAALAGALGLAVVPVGAVAASGILTP